MAKRFSRYEWGLKIMGGNIQENSPLGKYKKFRGKEFSITRIGTSPGKKVFKALEPFGLDLDPKKARVSVGSRAIGKVTDFSIPLTELALTDVNDNTEKIKFEPARIIVALVGSKGDKLPSAITGVPVQRYNGAYSYTFPFGKKAETNREAERMKALKALVEGTANLDANVTFKSEVVRI